MVNSSGGRGINESNIIGIASDVTLARELGWKDGLMIGIGGMIGGGVFSVLGVAASIAGPSLVLSFIFGGFMAIMTGYSYSKLAVLFPRAGGAYLFVESAFKDIRYGYWLKSYSAWLLWSAYVITCALYSFTFGAYFTGMLATLVAPVFVLDPAQFFWLKKIFTVVLILFFLNLNLRGVKEATSMQNKIVITKVLILIFFVLAGLFWLVTAVGLDNLIGPGPVPDWTVFFPNGPTAFIIAATVIFVAYEGFELIHNAADEMVEPKKDVPKAIYLSILIVWAIYVLVGFVAVGNLPYTTLTPENAEYALALAAEPVLQSFGFLLIGLGALFSTASAFNASLFGSSRLAFDMAKEELFPRQFLKLNKNRVPSKSLTIISLVTIAVAITLGLENIAASASVAFLAIFCLVNISAIRLREQANFGKTVIIPIIALITSAIALFGLILYYIGEQNWLALSFLAIYFVVVFIINSLSNYYSIRNNDRTRPEKKT
ncbi:MAG: APC family permease [Candidatus Odinarchaeota archaeon]